MSRFCSACGTPIPEGAKFCASCGHSVETAATPSSAPPPLPSNPPLPIAASSAFSFNNAAAFIEATQRLPWKQRPEAWWNTFSVLAGATGGLLWFVYSSIRGMPKPAFLYRLSLGPWLDFLPAIAMLLFAWIKRHSLVARVFQLQQRFEQKTLGGKAGLAAILIGGAYMVMRLIPQLRMGGEGLDVLTPVLMTLMPMGLVMFRKETDRLLAPIQPFRRRLGPVVAMGMSVAAPFATAYVLYHVFGFRMYPLMHANMPLGFLASYALARNPTSSNTITPPGGMSFPGVPAWLLMLLPSLIYLALTGTALADDFLRDPFNLNDGLRTDAFAPVLAGVSTAVVSILVNGVEITRTIIQDTKPVEEGETPEQRNFQVVVRSVDEAGATCTSLAPGDVVCILAHCEKEGSPFTQADPTIRFVQQDAQQSVAMTEAAARGSDRCVELRYLEAMPAGGMPATVTIVVSAGKGLISAPVTIALTGDYRLEFF